MISYSKLFETSDNKNNNIPKEYTWYALLDVLSNGDITKFDIILDFNYTHILNILSYYYYKNLNNKK